MGKRFSMITAPGRKGRSSGFRKTQNVRAKFEGRHSLEEISRLFQVFIAGLEQRGVHQLETCSLYFAPIDRSGHRMSLPNEDGEPLELMTIRFRRPEAPVTDEPEIAFSFGAQEGR